MAIESLQALVTASENRDICDVIIESDCVDRGVTQAESLEKMRGLYAAIRRAQRGYDPKLRSASGMVGGDGEKMRAYVQRGKTICGDYIGGVIAQALEIAQAATVQPRDQGSAQGHRIIGTQGRMQDQAQVTRGPGTEHALL